MPGKATGRCRQRNQAFAGARRQSRKGRPEANGCLGGSLGSVRKSLAQSPRQERPSDAAGRGAKPLRQSGGSLGRAGQKPSDAGKAQAGERRF